MNATALPESESASVRSTLIVRWSYSVDPASDVDFHFILTALDASASRVLRTWSVSPSKAVRAAGGNLELAVVDQATSLPDDLTYRLEVALQGRETVFLGTCRGRSHVWADRTSALGANIGEVSLSSVRICALDLDATRHLRTRLEASGSSRVEFGFDSDENLAIGNIGVLEHALVPQWASSLQAQPNAARNLPSLTFRDWTIPVPTPPPEPA